MAHRYFTTDIDGAHARITGPDAAHLAKVLRTKPGQQLTLCDGTGWDYTAEVLQAGPNAISLNIIERIRSATEPSVWAECFIAVGKGDKTDFAIQKAVELGASAIHPFYSEFSVAQPKNEQHKTERYTRIAAEAAKQASRGILPAVSVSCNFPQVLKQAALLDAALLFHPLAETPLAEAIRGKARVALVTGPEGGFSDGEIAQAREAGLGITGLGPRILRCETAPLAALAAVMVLSGNMG